MAERITKIVKNEEGWWDKRETLKTMKKEEMGRKGRKWA